MLRATRKSRYARMRVDPLTEPPKDGFRPRDQFCLTAGVANSSQTRESTNLFPTRSKAPNNL